MPLLAYCMMEAATAVENPSAGVGGAPLEQLQASGVRCFFSRFQSREEISPGPAIEAALAFHQVLQALFQQAVIIPFRFPTVMDSEQELLQYLQEHASRHVEALARLRHMVQMEIRITGSGAPELENRPASGLDYLRHKQSHAAELASEGEKFRQATRPWVVEWRERRTREGVRCYALLDRGAIAEFQDAAGTLSKSVPGARLSGPWPPAEFLEVKHS